MNTPDERRARVAARVAAGTPAAAPPTKATRPLYWSLRRELWENRSLYIAPLVIAGMLLLGSLISALYYGDRIVDIMEPVLKLDPREPGRKARQAVRHGRDPDHRDVVPRRRLLLPRCAHGERRERSILFWKSLPVSDLITVLSKASIPLVVLPLIAFVVILATQFVMLLIATAALETHGMSASVLWRQVLGFEGMVVLLYGLVVNSLWYAPVYGWLLMVSAGHGARRFCGRCCRRSRSASSRRSRFTRGILRRCSSIGWRGGFAAAFDVTGSPRRRPECWPRTARSAQVSRQSGAVDRAGRRRRIPRRRGLAAPLSRTDLMRIGESFVQELRVIFIADVDCDGWRRSTILFPASRQR